MGKYASFAAEDTREASSLPSDFDSTLTAFKFTKEAPDGYEAQGNPIFAVLTHGSIVGVELPDGYEQSYSLGAKAGDEFSISPDGYGLIPTGDETSGRKGSKFDLMKCSLNNEGVPSTVFKEGDFSKIVGLRAHWKRMDDEKLLGKAREFQNDNRKNKSKFPPQTLVCTKLLAMPGEVAKRLLSESAAPPATAPAATGGDVPDLDTETGLLLMSVLDGAKDHKVQRSQLTLHLSKAAGAQNPRRQDIARRGADEGFLSSLAEQGMIKYDPAGKPQIVIAA